MAKTKQPSINGNNGGDGRDKGGRFAKGNPGGPGNPQARRIGEIRAKLLECVTDDDLRAVMKALIAEARGGDVKAIELLFSRLLGKDLPIAAENIAGVDPDFDITGDVY